MRHLAAEVGDDHLRGLDGVLGLSLVEPDGLDDLGNVRHARARHGLRRGPELEQPWRHLVDLGIRGLRREQHRDDQTKRRLMIQEALDWPIATVQPLAELNSALPLGGVRLTRHG